MTAKTTHFPVDNGDMTLIETENGRRILIDCNIRTSAEDENDDTPNVAKQLRDRLKQDAQGRLYVDAFLLSHPDEDHCRGLKRNFHLGPPDAWSKKDDKIIIREMWSSPIVFRRASKNHKLCEDADAWAAEARRRVRKFKELGCCPDLERIKILGADVDDKTDKLTAILVMVDTDFSTIDGSYDYTFSARLIAPIPPGDDQEEEMLTKNDSSVVLNISLRNKLGLDGARYLFGGDAGVGIWERIWERNINRSHVLAYDVLLAPHHCSWHSLSWDSWSEKGKDAKVSSDARSALGQANAGAKILASSDEIHDDDNDPPCIRAKREYEDIAKDAKGKFHCIADGAGDDPYELEVTSGGVKPVSKQSVTTSNKVIGSQPLHHG
ncbi:metallohydrolase [Methylosinus sp. Ce-a6]|uniref:metallohydrolase n=1 Tax=Methylosinus sp. Ce-a6 TaxID=2172005 RepID=UPI0013569468|nr:metallohydrolase [Methylosinus sp. Ce-a6]